MYNIINDKEISTHLPLATYADILYKVSAADENLNSLGALSNHTMVMSKAAKIDVTNPDIKAHGKAKGGYQWAVMNKNAIFSFTLNKQVFFASEVSGTIECSLNRQEIEDKLNKNKSENQSGLNATEKKVWKWLETGNTGSSSLAMCAAFFPKLKEHHKIKNSIGHSMLSNFPHDNSDFKRCMDFLKEAGKKAQDVKIMKDLNPQWEKLSLQWQEIESLLNQEGDAPRKEAYILIKECTKAVPKPKTKK